MRQEDPVIYFYERFLNAYEKEQTKHSGVYYTPASVVDFMVRSVQNILKEKFGINEGMVSAGKGIVTETKTKKNGKMSQRGQKAEYPIVQILDPATSTGIFLRQVILQIYYVFRHNHR